MSDAFRELSPHELQRTLLQFMGENMGELKKLDAYLIEKNNTLQGMTLQPQAVLKSLPIPERPPQHVVPMQPQIQAVPVPQQVTSQAVQTPTVEVKVEKEVVAEDPNQLVFDFVQDLQNNPSIAQIIQKISNNVDYRSSDLCVALKRIEDKLDKVIGLCNDHKCKCTTKKKETLSA